VRGDNAFVSSSIGPPSVQQLKSHEAHYNGNVSNEDQALNLTVLFDFHTDFQQVPQTSLTQSIATHTQARHMEELTCDAVVMLATGKPIVVVEPLLEKFFVVCNEEPVRTETRHREWCFKNEREKWGKRSTQK
jgi:hypothetical protein